MAKITLNNFIGLAPAGNSRSDIKISDTTLLSSCSGDLATSPGYVSPGWSATTDLDTNSNISSALTSYCLLVPSQSPGSGIGTYFYVGGSKIHANYANSGNLDDATNYSNYPITITATGTHGAHTTFVADDIIIYRVGSTDYLFASYNDNTDGDVARVTIDGATKVYDFMSASAAGGATLGKFPHYLLRAENGFMYITDGPSIHKYDGATGANGTFTASAIDLPSNWVIVDIISFKGYAWVAALDNYSSNSTQLPRKLGIFLWNYQSRNSSDFSGFEKGSPMIVPNVMFFGGFHVWNGVPHIFVTTANNRTRIMKYDGTGFATIWDEPGDISPNNKRSISEYNGNIIWVDRNTGNLYGYGALTRGLSVASQYSINQTFFTLGSTGTSASAGILLSATSGEYWCSYSTKFKKLGRSQGLPVFATPWIELPKLSRITSLTFYFVPTSDTSNTSYPFALYKNFNSVAQATFTVNNSTEGSVGWKYFAVGTDDGENINSFKISMDNASGTIGMAVKFYRIDVEYDVTTKKK